MNIVTAIVRLIFGIAFGLIVMMVRICLAGGGSGSGSVSGSGGGGTSNSSSASGSGTSTSRIPRELKIGDVWYRNISKKCTGEVEIRKGMGDSVEYVARQPNPILHPNYYVIYDTRGNKVGEWR